MDSMEELLQNDRWSILQQSFYGQSTAFPPLRIAPVFQRNQSCAWVIMSISSVFGMGGNSVLARLLAEEKNKEAGSTLNFCLYAMALSGILVLLTGVLFIEPIARLSGSF